MVTNATEPKRSYPIPDEANNISAEFPRLRTALTMIGNDVDALLTSVSGRALTAHAHSIADVTGLQVALDGKAAASHTHLIADFTDFDLAGATNGQVIGKFGAKWQPWSILNNTALTGAPTAPTPAGGDNSGRLATTAYVGGEIAALAGASATALGNRVRVDAAQVLTATQQAQGRSNILAIGPEAAAYLGLLVNPSLQVSQENGTSAVSVSGAYPVDQWRVDRAGSMAFSAQQISDPFATAGFKRFRHGVKLTITTSQASLGSGDFLTVWQLVEGQMFKQLGWGTGDAKDVEVVAVISASVAGNYSIVIRNADFSRSFVSAFALAANTPTLIRIKIGGDTGGTWTTSNTFGLAIGIMAAAGSATIAPASNTWQAGNYLAASGQVNMAATTNATLIIGYCNLFPSGLLPDVLDPAGVALLRRTYDAELARCQRYWCSVRGGFTSPVELTSGYRQLLVSWPVQLRAVPSVSLSDTVVANGTFVNGAPYVQEASSTRVQLRGDVSATSAWSQINTIIANARM